jgi:hypothetical protein
MSNGPLRHEDLVIISALERLIAKEMNLVKVFHLQVVQTVRLIPAGGEDVERDLSANAVGEVEIGKFLLHGQDHVRAYAAFEVDLFVLVALLSGTVPSDGTDVHHAAAEFDERSPLRSRAHARTQTHINTTSSWVFIRG